MTAELLPDGYVSEGFEVVIGNPDPHMARIWNLWFNVTLSDDPRKWDDEIRAVNGMQKRLGGLTDEHRLIRAHMAEFCRYHPSFPGSIECLCEEIGTLSIEPPALGCEGRGLLQCLGYHKDTDIADQVRAELQAIEAALCRWQNGETPQTAADRRAACFLGEATGPKEEFTSQLCSVLRSGHGSIQPLRELTQGQCEKILGEAENHGRPFNCFGCLAPDEACPMCKCSYAMLVWAGMLCADTRPPDAPPEDVFLTFVQEHVLVYAAALNSWLSGSGDTGSSLPTMKSVSEADVESIAGNVHESLGEKTPEKAWLAACLLKTVAGNQRWRKGGELIGEYPGATSYLGRVCERASL